MKLAETLAQVRATIKDLERLSHAAPTHGARRDAEAALGCAQQLETALMGLGKHAQPEKKPAPALPKQP